MSRSRSPRGRNRGFWTGAAAITMPRVPAQRTDREAEGGSRPAAVPGKGWVTTMTIEPGDIFGWSALVPPHRATATAVVIEPVEAVGRRRARPAGRTWLRGRRRRGGRTGASRRRLREGDETKV